MTALECAFAARAQLVDAHPGFLGLELLRDISESGRYLFVTRRRKRGDFSGYVKSGDHARAHDRHHEGLGADGPRTLEQFHSVLEVRGPGARVE